jgi:hypothetical protein
MRRQHPETHLTCLTTQMAVGASHVIICVARDGDEMQGKWKVLTLHGEGAMPQPPIAAPAPPLHTDLRLSLGRIGGVEAVNLLFLLRSSCIHLLLSR